MESSDLLLKLAAAERTIVLQSDQICQLEAKVVLLLELVSQRTIKKDSHNSSLPPSSDLFKASTKSLRPPSSLKSGGQLGHDGTTLKMSDTPAKTIDLKTDFCRDCGASLSTSTFVLKARRQVIELPPITPIYEEYRQYSCTCSKCHREQIADFPLGITAPIQYGSSVEALISYLSVYQYVPFARLQNLFTHVFSLPLSQGTVGNILERSALKCTGIYELIKTQIAESQVVGSDETGAKVNGDKWWIWVWQNLKNTFIVPSSDRGSKTVDSIWQNGLPNAVLITDRWAAQLKANTKGHQVCLAHLLRNIIFLDEAEKHPFAAQFKELLLDIFAHKKISIQQQKAFNSEDKEAKIIEKRLNDLLTLSIENEKYQKTLTFQISMIKLRQQLLPCLYQLDIPPDNNTSEQAIRNIKVKQKVSGQFKSGQNAFCILRSVIDTLRKRGVDILPCLNLIIKYQPV